MKYHNLFSMIHIRGCPLPNRIMSTAAVTRLAAEDGHITQALTDRYKRMAKGGLGAMVVEAAVVLPSRSSFNLRISDDQLVPELRKFTDEIRTVNPDVKIGLQLIHFLKLSRSGWRQKVEDLSRQDISAIPQQFASGALRAQAAGFDFVELHMAHFTTLASFLSLVNKRQDGYGGDFEGRVKLPTEVILTIRDAVGDYPVGLRMNGEEYTKEGNTLLQSGRIARRLAKMGVDYISVSAGERFEDAEPPLPNFPPFAGTGYSGYRMSPRWWNPDGAQVYLAEGIRKAIRAAGYEIPVVTAGKIRTPELAEQILREGRADIIGMARALLCDPDWPIKAREDRTDEIVKCAACGFCSEADERYERVTCIQWPKGAINAPLPWLLMPPCQAACPAGLDIRGYVELIIHGRYEEALNLIEEKVPLPGTVGRVCPRPCETKCNRGGFDEPIAVNALKRFASDAVAAKGERKDRAPAVRTKDEKIAVVGSGPAGLSGAYYLVELGYGVTIFEAQSVPGGMMAMGIPDYRLPRGVLEAEIEAIQSRGVEIMLNRRVGKNGLRIESLLGQGFKAIFIAVGAHKPVKLAIPNEVVQGVVNGVSWLREINLGKKVKTGEKVVVIGGGNVAIDSARTALRLGAKEVSIAYRRSREEMTAIMDEVNAAEKEGIEIRYLSSPCRVVCEADQCRGLECFKTELGEFDESGRRRPIRVEGSEFVIDADMVISAIGEVPDLSFLDTRKFAVTRNNTIKVNPHTMATNVDGVFAGGDVVSGPATVIEAMAAGRKAAIAIDRYLRGESLDYELPVPDTIRMDDVDTAMFKKRKRQRMSELPPKRRVKGFGEVEQGFTELEALAEADRCFQCGMFPDKQKS
jgi:NADPH-dependent glutamate synthase beta subunit-like oxidoreductase/2,4-dienoyl-CoA reductase-like NADH-dependent reductase (Old Yellow Enzyme family)